MKELTNSLAARISGGAISYVSIYCATNNGRHFMGVYPAYNREYLLAFCQELGFAYGYYRTHSLDPNAASVLNYIVCDRRGDGCSPFDPSGFSAYIADNTSERFGYNDTNNLNL